MYSTCYCVNIVTILYVQSLHSRVYVHFSCFRNRAKSEGRFGGIRVHVYVFLTRKSTLAGRKSETTSMKCSLNVLCAFCVCAYVHALCMYVRM